MACDSLDYCRRAHDLLDPVVLYTVRLLWDVMLLQLFLVSEML